MTYSNNGPSFSVVARQLGGTVLELRFQSRRAARIHAKYARSLETVRTVEVVKSDQPYEVSDETFFNSAPTRVVQGGPRKKKRSPK